MVIGGEEKGKRARVSSSACRLCRGPVRQSRELQQWRPLRRTGNGAGGELIGIGILGPTELLGVRAVSLVVGADAAALVLGLIKLAVDYMLEDNQQNTEEHREENEANVGLHVTFLEGKILPEKSVGLSPEARRSRSWICHGFVLWTLVAPQGTTTASSLYEKKHHIYEFFFFLQKESLDK